MLECFILLVCLLHHSDADGWRGRPFPRYEAFSHIFGVDRAVGTSAKVPAAILDEVNDEPELQEQADPSHSIVDNDLLSTTKSAMKSRSEYTSKKRKRENDNIILQGLDKVATTFKEVMETSNENIRLLVEYFQPKASNKDEVRARKNEFWGELLKLEMSTPDRIKALKLLMADGDLFLALDTEEEKREYIMQLL